jgi:hypothetical protein
LAFGDFHVVLPTLCCVSRNFIFVSAALKAATKSGYMVTNSIKCNATAHAAVGIAVTEFFCGCNQPGVIRRNLGVRHRAAIVCWFAHGVVRFVVAVASVGDMSRIAGAGGSVNFILIIC